MSVPHAAGGLKPTVSFSTSSTVSTAQMVTTNSARGGICVTAKTGRAEHNHPVFKTLRAHPLNQVALHTYLTKKTMAGSQSASIDNASFQRKERLISVEPGKNPYLTALLREDVNFQQLLKSNHSSWKVSATSFSNALLAPALSTDAQGAQPNQYKSFQSHDTQGIEGTSAKTSPMGITDAKPNRPALAEAASNELAAHCSGGAPDAHTENHKTGITDSDPVSCRNRGGKRAAGSRDNDNNDGQLSGTLDKRKCNNPGTQDELEKLKFNDFLYKQYQALIAMIVFQAASKKEGDSHNGIRFTSTSQAQGKIEIDCGNKDQVINLLGGRENLYQLLIYEAAMTNYGPVYIKEAGKTIVINLEEAQEVLPPIVKESDMRGEGAEITSLFNDCMLKQHQAMISMIIFQAKVHAKNNCHERVMFISSTDYEIEIDGSNKNKVIDLLGGGESLWTLLDMIARNEKYSAIEYKKENKNTIEVDVEKAKVQPVVMQT